MPRIPRTEDEIAIFKQSILDTALSLINEDGFQNLSMRKIANRMDVSATTIYNYFHNQDELYFVIRIHGFEELCNSLEAAFARESDPDSRMREMMESFIRFGLDRPDYFDLMFVNRNVPKYLDAVGTLLEAVAFRDKQAGNKTLALVAAALSGACPPSTQLSEVDLRFLTEKVWCELTGILVLNNSRLLHEVEENIPLFIERISADLLSRVRNDIKSLTGENKGI